MKWNMTKNNIYIQCMEYSKNWFINTSVIIDYIDGNYNIGESFKVYASNKILGCAEITGEFPNCDFCMEAFNYDTVNLEGYDTGFKINFKLFDNNKSQYIPLGTNLDSHFLVISY